MKVILFLEIVLIKKLEDYLEIMVIIKEILYLEIEIKEMNFSEIITLINKSDYFVIIQIIEWVYLEI